MSLECDITQRELKICQDEIGTILEENRALKRLLRSLEAYDYYGECVFCKAHCEDGHNEDCEYNNILGGFGNE